MDEIMQHHLDAIVEQEIAQGYRIKEVPQRVVKLLQYAHQDDPSIPILTKVRFSRLTPRQKKLVGEETVVRANADMAEKRFLTYEETRVQAVERGAWTEAEDDRIAELQKQASAEMQDLYLRGFDHRTQWIAELQNMAAKVVEALEKNEQGSKLKAVLERLMAYSDDQQASYTEKYAAEQGLPEYSYDRDYMGLLDALPDVETQDTMMELDSLREKVEKLAKIIRLREELDALQTKQAKVFGNCIEFRRDKVTEMAQLYYGTKMLNDKSMPTGLLTPTFDALWDLPDGAIDWLLQEAFFFYEGIPDSARAYLEQWGFMRAERDSGSLPASDESPAPQTSKSDTQPAAGTAAVSSESEPVKG